MAFVIRTAKSIRNNWKKSTVAAIALYYAYDYTREHFEIQRLMRTYCEKAAEYGKQPIAATAEPRHITVILNPSANKRKANDDFDKYCAPIFHLAGICVNIIKTESEGHARDLIADLNNTDAIVVAGGDGTLSEVVTGLLRRTEEKTEGLIPLGILPLGKTNSVAETLFPAEPKLKKIHSMADASMAVVEEVVKPLDVLKIELMDGDNKPVYALSGIKWGAYRDAETKKDAYWYYGSLRKYATYLFNGYKSGLTWNCNATVCYTPPCSGCANCAKAASQPKKWFHRFAKAQPTSYYHVNNPECSSVQEKEVSTVDFTLSVQRQSDIPKLQLTIGPPSVDYFDFVKDGWRSEKGERRSIKEIIEARSVEIRPKLPENNNTEVWFSIDNENYEVKPIKVTLLPRLINVFCKKDSLL